MSLIFFIGFLMLLAGEMPSELYDAQTCTVWALFSIADALWIKGR